MGFIGKKRTGWLWVLMSCEGIYTETTSACASLLVLQLLIPLFLASHNNTEREKETDRGKLKSGDGLWRIIIQRFCLKTAFLFVSAFWV